MDASAPDIKDLEDQLDAAERDAQALAAGLAEERGGWHVETGSWSVAECLDHLATAEPRVSARYEGASDPRTRARQI